MADIEVKQTDTPVSIGGDVTPATPSETVSPTGVANTTPATSAPAATTGGGKAGRSLPWAWLLAGLLAVAVIALGWWSAQLMSDKNSLQKQLDAANANPQAIIDKQTNDLIAKVGKLMNLPTGETPTIANVTDAAKAKQQSAFFANAQNGDKVLLYVKAGEAILYRPSTNKIILVAPLTFASPSATSGTTNTTTKH